LPSADRETDFGVYIHWPFCLSKCPYCDFNSHVRHAPIDEERFARAFAREIETTAARAPKHTVTSIFLGGGTPSLIEADVVAQQDSNSQAHSSTTMPTSSTSRFQFVISFRSQPRGSSSEDCGGTTIPPRSNASRISDTAIAWTNA